MTEPSNQDQDFGPEHFAGWPATVPTERLERAIQYVRDQAQLHPDMEDLPVSGDENLDMDMLLTAQSMTNFHNAAEVDLTPLDRASGHQFLEVLREILQDRETEHGFACAVISHMGAGQPQQPATIEIRHIFTLARHPDWMGLSLALPDLRDHHVHAWESRRHPASPRAMIAVPDIMMPEQAPPSSPAPRGGLRVLAEVAAWHGAASFHWFPARHRP